MILVNSESIYGKELVTLGIVKGSCVMSKHIGSDIGASFKTLVGGEIKGYTDMMNQSRELATSRMIAEAQAMGADAIISVRYTSSAVMQNAAEVLAYGTAVKFA